MATSTTTPEKRGLLGKYLSPKPLCFSLRSNDVIGIDSEKENNWNLRTSQEAAGHLVIQANAEHFQVSDTCRALKLEFSLIVYLPEPRLSSRSNCFSDRSLILIFTIYG